MDGNIVIEPTMDYDFSKLYLGPPSTILGGAYFTRIMYSTNKQLFIQTPKSLTKQGFVKSGKKVYADLMFDNNDTVFINWIENLESKCQELIHSKGQNWFESGLEKDDIEAAFTSPFKIFKSGKFYLLRVNVKPTIKIYDETDKIFSIDDVSSEKHIISILEIQGIKFTSRNFQIEIELKQAMIVSPDPFLETCFIKRPTTTTKPNVSFGDMTKQLVDNVNVDNAISNSEIDIDELINSSVNELTSNIHKPDLQTIDLDDTFEEKETQNIKLEIEEVEPEPEPESEPEPEPESELKEVDLGLTIDSNLSAMSLKKPNQVYYEIYQKAREKAKEAKKTAISAYLEMKNIKKTYMLDDIDDSDSEFDVNDNYSDASESDSLDPDILDIETLENNY